MSNPRAWRGKGRTPTPNSRQKRNRLYLDAHPVCQACGQRPAVEAHHELSRTNRNRYDWQHMKALCVPCHVTEHQRLRRIYKSIRGDC